MFPVIKVLESVTYQLQKNREHIVVRSVFWLSVASLVLFASLAVANILQGLWPSLVHCVGLIASLAVGFTAQFADSLDYLPDED